MVLHTLHDNVLVTPRGQKQQGERQQPRELRAHNIVATALCTWAGQRGGGMNRHKFISKSCYLHLMLCFLSQRETYFLILVCRIGKCRKFPFANHKVTLKLDLLAGTPDDTTHPVKF